MHETFSTNRVSRHRGGSGQITRIGFRATCVLTLSLLTASSVYATPLLKGGKNGRPPAFPKNSTLCVLIQADPKGQGRDQLLKEGVERWTKPLADRMITVNVVIGDPPAGKTNPIRYRWVNDGILSNGMEIGPGKNDGAAQPITSPDGSTLVGGEAVIRNALPATTDAQKEALRTVGQHELVHALGLADDNQGDVTRHAHPSSELNDRDKKELNFLYGTATSGGTTKPTGQVLQIGGGAGMGFFQYQLNFVAANALANPSDPEHVSLFTMNIPPSLVTGVAPPPGWLGFVPGKTVAMNDPFFADGFMLDGAGDPPPWDPTSPMAYVAFRASPEEALRDGLPPGFDPALSLDNPSLLFTISTTPSALDGPVQVWSGDASQTVVGPVVPEPSSLVLLGSGLLGLAGWRRRFRI